jgi:hypothetical protein
MSSVSYRVYEDGKTPDGARVEVVSGLVTEYGTLANDGGFDVWPADNEEYPTARRIGHASRNGIKVLRRRILVIEEWTEVNG